MTAQNSIDFLLKKAYKKRTRLNLASNKAYHSDSSSPFNTFDLSVNHLQGIIDSLKQLKLICINKPINKLT